MSTQTPQRLSARETIVGTNTPIRRALPNRVLRMIGAWCFLDHVGPVQFDAGMGLHVGPHPHIGLQTFTWMIEGEIMHRDSLGHEQVIRPGQVNLMTSGRGIAHTEDSVEDGSRMHAAQLWIALPDGERHREPDFRNYPDLPVVEDGGFNATVLAGEAFGQRSPVKVYSPLVGIDLASASAARTCLPLHADWEYGAMALEGEVRIDGTPLGKGELLYFAPGRSSLVLEADDAARILLVGGAPFGESILLWWNFVARTQEELEAAVADWKSGERFGTVRPGSPAPPLKVPPLEGVTLRPS